MSHFPKILVQLNVIYPNLDCSNGPGPIFSVHLCHKTCEKDGINAFHDLTLLTIQIKKVFQTAAGRPLSKDVQIAKVQLFFEISLDKPGNLATDTNVNVWSFHLYFLTCFGRLLFFIVGNVRRAPSRLRQLERRPSIELQESSAQLRKKQVAAERRRQVSFHTDAMACTEVHVFSFRCLLSVTASKPDLRVHIFSYRCVSSFALQLEFWTSTVFLQIFHLFF